MGATDFSYHGIFLNLAAEFIPVSWVCLINGCAESSFRSLEDPVHVPVELGH